MCRILVQHVWCVEVLDKYVSMHAAPWFAFGQRIGDSLSETRCQHPSGHLGETRSENLDESLSENPSETCSETLSEQYVHSLS